MPPHNIPLHHRLLRALVPLLALAPVAVGATESTPRACESELNFRAIAQMIDESRAFETRLVLLLKSMVQGRSQKHVAGDEEESTAGEIEEINLGTLRNGLGEVSGYLLASENLAAIRDLMVDERDGAAVNRQLRLVAQQIQEPLSFALESAESVSAMTKRPAIAAEVSKIHDFMDQTRSHFAACAGTANR